MKIVPHTFGRFIGKMLEDVSAEIQKECDAHGYTFSVLDKTMPNNIDVEPNRLNFYVDSKFIIKKIWFA